MLQANSETALIELVQRIIAKDPRAEEEMILRYRNGVFQIIYQIVHNRPAAEDLCQDSLLKALEKIRRGDLREPEKLSGFICGIAKFVALGYIRKTRSSIISEDVDAAEHIPDPAPDPYEQALNKEKARIVHKVISEMTVQRDREVLSRYYILEEEKSEICADLGLTREQFARIIFRAHKRYKEIHLKLTDKP